MAPIAGETKVWQYITLMKRIFLIDCPGVVYASTESDAEKVLKGVVRVELVTNPEDYIPPVLERVRPEYLRRQYRLEKWTDSVDFLEQLAKRSGKLLKGGEPDIASVAKMVLNDWQRGKLPFYVAPEAFETPKSQAGRPKVETATDKKSAADVKDKAAAETLHQIQDFRKIKVGLEFEKEDLRKLDKIDLDLLQQQKIERKESRKRKIAEAEEESSGISDFYSEDEFDPTVQKMVRKKSKSIAATDAADAAVVVQPSKKVKKEKVAVESDSDDDIGSDDEEDFGGEEEISHVRGFKVDDVQRPTPVAGQQKLTAKQKRASVRSQKRKKIGSNFYEVSNVKNKNRAKKDKK